MKGYPYSPERYPDEPFDVYQLRRWTENRFFKLLQSDTMFYPSEYMIDRKHGRRLPYRKEQGDTNEGHRM